MVKFKPLEWQIPVWRDKSQVILLTGSAGGGKSRIAAEKLHGACLKYPNTMCLAVRKTRESMTNSTVLFLERTVVGRGATHIGQKHRFEYANGSILAYGGMKDDEQREQVRGLGGEGGVDLVWMEEAMQFTEDDFNELKARLRGKAMHPPGSATSWRQIILTTNPDAPSHWINQRLILGNGARIYCSRAEDNPTNPPEYIATLDSLTGVLGERLRGGKWVQAEGAVYDVWDSAIHLIDPFPIPREWRKFRAVDFGYTNPFVCQWWAIDGDGRMYRYREIYRTKRTVTDHAAQINELSRGDGYIEATVCDHDAEDRATLEQNGISTLAATKDVSRGIQAVTTRMCKAKDGKPRLFLMRGALVEQDPNLLDARTGRATKPTCTEEEIEGYAWQRLGDGKPNKEEPTKTNDHGCDAMRYGTMYLAEHYEGSFVLKAR
jgi:phage terminase large subunit